MRVSRLLLVLSLLLLTVTPQAAAGEERWGLDQIEAQLAALRAKIEQLKTDASRDPRELLLAKYVKFGADDWSNKKREPRVKDMIEWVFSDKCHMDLREGAATAMGNAIWKDPDLSSARVKKRQSARAKFSEKLVVPHLGDKETANRKLAAMLMTKFWGDPRDPEITLYRYQNRSTAKAARRAWNKLLDNK